MSKEIDIQLKRQLQNTPKVIKNFLQPQFSNFYDSINI